MENGKKKSNIENLLKKLKGTREEEILCQTEELYDEIKEGQSVWYEKSSFTCPSACGQCCKNFEPDLLDCEADYMAAWLLEKRPELADEVSKGNFPFAQNKGCPFWDENNDYHCTIYEGRAFICRFFGAYGSRSKTGENVFKPCKFYPAEKLAEHNPPLSHRQYNQKEMQEIFGVLPPLSTDIMEKALVLNPDNTKTKMLRDILPKAVNRLKWLLYMAGAEERSEDENGAGAVCQVEGI